MLSYQHIYHAGNLADVHKHLWLLTILDYLLRKDKPFCWIDTHAGRGAYDLHAPEADKLREYEGGIAKIWDILQSSKHPILNLYAHHIARLNGGGSDLHIYPGSAMLAAQMLRDDDRLFAFDMHKGEVEFLIDHLSTFKMAQARKDDGYLGLKSLIPPQLRRGGVLIDPSYEVKDEYAKVASAVIDAALRWPQGVYMVWYPILSANRHESMCESLVKFATDHAISFNRDEWMFKNVTKGMAGSGLFVLNTPYTCGETMNDIRHLIMG